MMGMGRLDRRKGTDMNVVVATDGSLDAKAVVDVVKPMATKGSLSIITVVEVPRRMLADLRAVYGERLGSVGTSDGEYVGIAPDKPGVGRDFPGEETILDQYLANQKEERTASLAAAFEDVGIKTNVEIIESDHVAKSIVEYLKHHKTDVVVMGAQGSHLFDTLLGSTSHKVSRHAPCSVLLVR